MFFCDKFDKCVVSLSVDVIFPLFLCHSIISFIECYCDSVESDHKIPTL
jgi:hypothetical protein